MINNVNNYYSTIKNMEIEQIPQISNPILDIYAKHVNCAFKPKKMDLNLQSRVEDLNKFNHVIEKAKNSSTFHKVMSVCLLAASVSLIATGIILACAIDPLFGLIGAGAIFSSISAQCMHDSNFKYPATPRNGGLTLPGLDESIYVFDAFFGTKHLENQLNKKLEPLNERIEMLKKLLENHSVIKQGIEAELKQIDITKIDVLDVNRIEQLKMATIQLNKAVVMLQKLEQ